MKDLTRFEEPNRKYSSSDEELEFFHGFESEFDEEIYNTETGHGNSCHCRMCKEAQEYEYFLGDIWGWGKGIFDGSNTITYSITPGEEFGRIHKSRRPPGLPNWARKAGEKNSALQHVQDFAKQEKLGSIFVKAIKQMAIIESGARFALPATFFNANPPSKRSTGKKLVTAWGVFQFNRDAWTCLYSKNERTSKKSYIPKTPKGTPGCKGCRGQGGCILPWDCTTKEEIERPIKKYAQLFRNILNAGGNEIDAAAGLRIWHKSPNNYKKWFKEGEESSFEKAWSSQLSAQFRNSIKSFLNKASMTPPYELELLPFDRSVENYEFDNNQLITLDEVNEVASNHLSDIQKIRNTLDFPIIRDPYPEETLEGYLTWHADGPINFSRYFSVSELIKLHKPNSAPCTISSKSFPRNEIPPRKFWSRIVPTLYLVAYLRHQLGVPLKVAHGWRPTWFNAHVCGAANSQHLKFAAMDVDLLKQHRSRRMMEMFYQEAVKIYIAVGPWFDMGLGLYRSTGYGARVHIDSGWKMRSWKPGYAKKVADKIGLKLPKP